MFDGCNILEAEALRGSLLQWHLFVEDSGFNPWLHGRGPVSLRLNSKLYKLTTDFQSARLSWNKAPIWGLLLYDICRLVEVGRSLWREGRVCRLPESQSAVISLLSVCKIYRLHIIKCIYNIYKASVSSGSVEQIMPMKSSGRFAPWDLRPFL
jgi:hypothetical protein